jgi:hypothetical protein
MRYFVEYGMPNDIGYGQVTKDDLPHDCDWLRSPLGEKGCHYEASVQVVRTKQGLPIQTGRFILTMMER